MKNTFLIIVTLLFFVQCKNITTETTTTRIAFGSCAYEEDDQPMLNVARSLSPDAFIYLGDNIYGDTEDMEVLKAKYAKLAIKPEFDSLVNSTKVFAVWDDHDYGENDAGRYYPFKEESKEIFMDFWKVSADSERRKHKGIYGTEYLKHGNNKIQIILLDTRTFRDNLIHRPKEDTTGKNDYLINNNPDSTFLGKEQWKWLEEELKKPAKVRIIASSNQFGHEYNGWESWTNVAQEQQKMINLIKNTKANGVIFISGDVHWGEISKMKTADNYPIYDVTSSGITKTWDKIEANKNRIGQPVPQNNIGSILIKTDKDETTISLELYDITNEVVVSHQITLDEISFK